MGHKYALLVQHQRTKFQFILIDLLMIAMFHKCSNINVFFGYRDLICTFCTSVCLMSEINFQDELKSLKWPKKRKSLRRDYIKTFNFYKGLVKNKTWYIVSSVFLGKSSIAYQSFHQLKPLQRIRNVSLGKNSTGLYRKEVCSSFFCLIS